MKKDIRKKYKVLGVLNGIAPDVNDILSEAGYEIHIAESLETFSETEITDYNLVILQTVIDGCPIDDDQKCRIWVFLDKLRRRFPWKETIVIADDQDPYDYGRKKIVKLSRLNNDLLATVDSALKVGLIPNLGY